MRPTSRDVEARNWAMRAGMGCPSCGARLVLDTQGGPEDLREQSFNLTMQFERAGGRVELITIEDAEQLVREWRGRFEDNSK